MELGSDLSEKQKLALERSLIPISVDSVRGRAGESNCVACV